MKERGKNREIEKLFSKQFSAYELEPSPQFWNRFRKILNAKEFLRFNPGRFNAWYLGALVISAVIGTSLILGSPKIENGETPTLIDSQAKDQSAVINNKDVISKLETEKLSKGSPEASGRITTVKIETGNEERGSADKLSAKEKRPDSEMIISEKLPDKIIVESDKLVRLSPSANFSISTNSGCIPLRVSFENMSANWDSCIWDFGDGGFSELESPIWVFDEKGDFQVTLIVFGENGEKAVSKQIITAYPLPEARFEISDGEAMLPEEEVHFFNYSDNSVSWEWKFGDGTTSTLFEPDHKYSKAGSYSVSLLAISQHGCIDSMIVSNAFDDNSCYIKFPNAFIPNAGGPTGGYFTNWSDERSEVFHPVWSGVTQYQLRIFSRMGILIFESNDINIGWDGYIKGEKAEPGVYIWKVRGLFKNGDPFVQAGDVTILPKL